MLRIIQQQKNNILLMTISLVISSFIICNCTKVASPNKPEIKAQSDTLENRYSAISLNNLFDLFDSKVNQGKGYSEYVNSEGFPSTSLLAWSESYLMQGYANMYEASGDIKYLDKLHDHTQSILSKRDDRIGKLDYKGDQVPCWGTDKYTRNHAWMHFIVHTGMITYPMLEFVYLVRQSNIEKYLISGDIILRQVEESVEYHDKDWRNDHYVYPDDFYKKNYIVPISQQAAIGRTLLLLYELTGKEKYLKMTMAIAKLIETKSIKEERDGRYLLRNAFQPGKDFPDDTMTDISHAAITIHFANLTYKKGIIFQREDIQKFTKTIMYLAENNNNHFPKYLDGTGDYEYEVAAGQYAFLAEYDPRLIGSIMELYFKHIKIEETTNGMKADWWGTVMLGLSRVILFQSK